MGPGHRLHEAVNESLVLVVLYKRGLGYPGRCSRLLSTVE
jgi:hypothetical protein